MARRLKFLHLGMVASLFVLAACGGGGDSQIPNPTPGITVSIAPKTMSLLVRSSAKFTASISGSTNTDVTFSVAQGTNGGDILNTGDYLAPKNAGVYTVRATSVADPSKFSEATVTVRDYGSSVTPVAAPPDGYDYSTASLLVDGSVLVVGGRGVNEPIHRQAMRYVPSTNLYQMDALLNTARMAHVAFTLPSGKVVVAGGFNPYVPGTDFDPAFASSEIYDPATKTFSAGPEMNFPRRQHVATQLKDSRVLITGGIQLRGDGFGASTNTEIFDPAMNSFTIGNRMNEGRWLHTATLLANGRVLIVGGRNNNCTANCPVYSLNSAEIFDPATGNFIATGSLNISRYDHTATLLPDGRVLILGGETTEDLGTGNDQVGTAEIFDPVAGQFTTWTNLVVPRSSHAAVTLNNGKIWLTGGYKISGIATDRTEFFDPATGASVEGPLLNEYHVRPLAIRLQNGEVLVFSGWDGGQAVVQGEIFK